MCIRYVIYAFSMGNMHEYPRDVHCSRRPRSAHIQIAELAGDRVA